MNTRKPEASKTAANLSATIMLLEVELPNTSEFEAFEAEFDASLSALEARFSEFVTKNSFAGSIGR